MIQLWAGLTTAAVWGYISAVLLFKEPDLPFRIDVTRWLLLDVVAFLLGYLLAARAACGTYWSASRVSNYCLFGTVLMVCLVIADTGYSVYVNSRSWNQESPRERAFDKNTWIGELYPRLYYPTERNFRLHKPGVSVSGSLYGNFYRTPMRSSTTLADNVIEKRSISIKINDLGFREATPIAEAEIFALGDSFTFGWGVNEFEGWVELLESKLEAPVYNLGIHDASPKQELELLDYVLDQHGENVHLKQLLWMIYEGNDLEDDYSESAQGDRPTDWYRFASGTLVEVVAQIPGTLKEQSIINKLRSGVIALKGKHTLQTAGRYVVDGVALSNPLFFSETLGYRMFYRPYFERATKPLSYIHGHPNRPRLEAVFAEVKSLSESYNFEVAIIVVPSAARLHGPAFDGLPKATTDPHFIDFVVRLSQSLGFETVNLYRLMQPYAETELLYFRDDDHFNQRGNALAAQLIEQELFRARN
jgi:lysophospholipase L1-like esterase